MKNFEEFEKSLTSIFKVEDLFANEHLKKLIAHENKSCPFSQMSKNSCKQCRLAIPLISLDEQDKIRKSKGASDIPDWAYTCPIKVIGYKELMNIKKVVAKAKAKKKNKGE